MESAFSTKCINLTSNADTTIGYKTSYNINTSPNVHTSTSSNWQQPEWGGVNYFNSPRRIPVLEVIKEGIQVENLTLDYYKHDKPYFVLGRAPSCDIILEHPSISRFHAVMQSRSSDGSSLLIDLSSTQGTFINKQRLTNNEPCLLSAGDIVQFALSKRFYVFSELLEFSSESETSESGDESGAIDSEYACYHQEEETNDETEYDRTSRARQLKDRVTCNKETLLQKISELDNLIGQNESILESFRHKNESTLLNDDPLERYLYDLDVKTMKTQAISLQEKITHYQEELRHAQELLKFL